MAKQLQGNATCLVYTNSQRNKNVFREHLAAGRIETPLGPRNSRSATIFTPRLTKQNGNS